MLFFLTFIFFGVFEAIDKKNLKNPGFSKTMFHNLTKKLVSKAKEKIWAKNYMLQNLTKKQ